jgi:hypothetical protein
MHHYTVQYGDTPRSIARRFGIHVRQLIAANPNKPVVNVSGDQTWSALSPGERLRVPYSHEFREFITAPAFASPVPYAQSVPSWQPQTHWRPAPPVSYHPGRFRFEPHHGLRGVGDVLAGHRFEEALRLREGRRGYEYGGNPYGVAETGVGDAASDAVQALLAAGDPCDPANAPFVCLAQTALGLQADGKWGAGTAKKAQAAYPGAPGPCSPRPAWWAPKGQSNCGASAPPSGPLPSGAPPALLALASLDPCSPANVSTVCAVQVALGLQPDGKWGAGTAAKARAVMPNAPPACSPRPGWWAAKGQSNCGGAAPAPGSSSHGGGGFIPPPPAGSAPSSTQASMIPGGGSISTPHGGASTMAVAGVLGVIGLGAIALVATGNHERIITRYKTRRAPAPAPAPVHHRAPAPRRAPSRRGLSRRPKRK